MNQILIYILVILIFLGTSTSFSPSERGTAFIDNETVFGNYITEEGPLSLILVDSFQTGFLIKTFYQKYRIVYAFKQPKSIVIRTYREFWEKNLKNIGMSLFRKREHDDVGDITVLPPGSLYVGNLAYGNWLLLDSGDRVWRFYRGHRHLTSYLGWGKFRPSYEFYKKLQFHSANKKPFYGLNNNFGINGAVTQQNFIKNKEKTVQSKPRMAQILRKFISLPPNAQKEDFHE